MSDQQRVPVPDPRVQNGRPMVPQWLITGVILVSLAMWVLSIVYSAINPTWPVPPSVHGVVIAVVTGVLGYLTVARAKSDARQPNGGTT